MDINFLRGFVAVAHHRSFTKAAEELGTNQPNLSRVIQRLEDIVGERLFDRSKRQIRLTPSGRVLLEEAQPLIDQAGLALRRARIVGHGSSQVLRVGFSTTMWMHYVHGGLRDFRALHPDVDLTFKLMSPREQADALRRGEIDAGLIDISWCDRRDLTWQVIGREPFVLAIPSDWDRGGNGPVDLAAFSEHPFVISDPELAPEVHKISLACCLAAGFQPHIAEWVREGAEMRFLVAAGVGAGFAFGSAIQTQFEGVRFVPMKSQPPEAFMEVSLIWAKKPPPPVLKALIDCVVARSYLVEVLETRDGFEIGLQNA